MNIFKRIILSLVFFALANNAMAAAVHAVKSGNWNDNTVWSTNAVPGIGDAVTVALTFTVTVDGAAPAQCASLTIGTAAVVGVVQMGDAVTGAGNLTVASGGTISVLAKGTLEANGSFGGRSFITINSGAANALKITAGGVFNMNNGSVCDVYFTGTASTITGVCTFYSLIVNTSTTVTLASNETVDSNVIVQAGTLAVAATTLTVSNGAIAGTGNVYVGGAPGEATGTGTMTLSSGTLSINDSLTIYTGSTVSVTTTGRILPTVAVYNMGTLSYTATGTFTGGGNVYNSGTLACVSTIINTTGSIINYGTGTITGTSGKLTPGGYLVQQSSGNIAFSTTGAITVGLDLDITSSGSITTGTGTITVTGGINMSGSGDITPTTGSITVTNGNVTLSSTAQINPSGAANLTLTNGNLSLSGNSAITLLAAANLDVVKGTSNIGAMCGVTLATGTYTSGSDLTLGGTLTFSSGAASNLKIAGNFAFTGSFPANQTTVLFNGVSSQTISGPNITFYKLTISNAVSLLPGTTAFTVSNTFLISALVGTFDVGTNDFNCGGTMTNSNVTASSATSFNAESQTVNFNGTVGAINGAQQFTFNNLYINVGGGNTVTELGTHLTPMEIVKATGTLTVNTGTLATTTTTIQVLGNVVLGDTYTATTGTLQVGGNFTNNGTFTEGTGTVLMNGTANQTIGGTTATVFYSLTETNTGAAGSNIVTLGNAITVAANLNITSGQLNCYVYNLTATSVLPTATFTLAANTTFLLGDPTSAASAVPLFPNGFKTYTFNAASTVVYEADAAQMLYDENHLATAITYGNVDVYTGGASATTTLTNAIAFIITGNLTIGDGISAGTATLMGSTTNITVDGNVLINNNGAYTATSAITFIEGDFTVNNNTGFTPNGGTIDMFGTLAQNHNQNINGTATSLTFYNLTFNNLGAANNTTTLSYPITVNNTLTFTTGILDVGAGNNQITCNGNFVNTPNVTTSLTARNGTVLFTPAAAYTISGAGQTNFYNVTVSAGAFSTTVTGTHAVTQEVIANELSITSGTFSVGTKIVSVGDSATIQLGGVLGVAAAGKLAVTNGVSNSGTIDFTGAGTITTTTAAGSGPSTSSTYYQGSIVNYAGSTYTGIAGCTATIGNSFYDFTGNAISDLTGTITAADSVYIASGASISFSTGTLKATIGNINNNGTIAYTGIGALKAVNFYNTAGATVTGLTAVATIGGSLYNLGTVGSTSLINFTTGTINVTDSVYNAVGGTIDFTAGTLHPSGDIDNYGSIAFSAAAGTLKAANLYINNPSGIVNMSTTGTATMTGNVEIASGGTLQYSGAGNLNIAGSFSDYGTFTPSTGTATFNNAAGATQIITGSQPASGIPPAIPIIFNKLTVNGTGNKVLLADSVQTNGLLTLTSGTFDVSTSDYHLTCKAGFTNSTGIPTAFNSEAGCVWFVGAQNVTGKTIFNDAVLENGNITMASPMVFLDTLTSVTGSVSAGLLKNTSPNTVTIGNSLFNNSAVAFTPATTGIVLFENNTNSTCQIGSITAHAITLKNLTVNLAHATDVVNMTTALTVNTVDSIQNGIFNCENFTLTGAVAAGTFLYMSSTSELTLGLETSATNSAFPLYTTYNLDAASTVIYEAATNLQKINASPTYGNLKVFIGGASGIAKTFLVAGSTLAIAGNLTVGDASTVGVATLNCTTSTVNLTGSALINNDGNITFTTAAGAFNIGGNFTNNLGLAGFTGGLGTTTFNNTTTTQTISGTAATTFYNVAIGANAYNVIISQNENAGGTFTINSGATFDCGSVALSPSVYPTMSVTGLFTNGGIFLGDVGTLALSGDLTNNSTFTAQTGTVSFNKAGTENINGSKALSFYNATLNGSVNVNISTLGDTLTHVLSLSGASCQLNGSQTLTMASKPSFSAQIGPVTTGANISLPFVMERYVGGTKANYEALACPSQASTLHDWAYDAGFYMSGVGGPDGNAGTFQSVYTINEPTDAYVAVTTTSFPLTPGLGLYIYMATTISSFTPFTFATHGIPTYGSFTYGITHSASPGTGSNLVGNPYDCPLSWTALVATNVSGIIGSGSSAYFSIFDRTLGNWVSSNGTTVTNASSVLASNPNVIPEHQGFLVSAASSGNMTFAEADKTTVDQVVYKPYTGGVADLFNITLSDNMNAYQGGTSIEFNNNSKAMYVQGEDVLYMKSLTQEAPILYTLSSDGKFLNVNSQPLSTDDEQDVMFYAGGNITGNYTLTFKGIDKLSKFNCIQLEDLRLGKTVQIEEGSSYTYQLNNTGTYKFIIHFKKLQQGLPCIISVAANGGINQDLNAAVDIYKNQNGITAKFTLSESQPAIISVYNTLGQKVEQDITRNVMDEEVEIPLPSISGMYIIRIETPGGVTTKRIYQ